MNKNKNYKELKFIKNESKISDLNESNINYIRLLKNENKKCNNYCESLEKENRNLQNEIRTLHNKLILIKDEINKPWFIRDITLIKKVLNYKS